TYSNEDATIKVSSSSSSGVLISANEKTEEKIQVRIFRDACFSLKYPGFPTRLEENEIVYVELEGIKTQMVHRSFLNFNHLLLFAAAIDNYHVAIPEECYVSANKKRDHCPTQGYQLISD
ncbi:hypothetical protein pdam_00007001, partial [Pocillopora damicornis]